MRRKIVLASGSPRRRELLEGAGVNFRIAVKFEVDETITEEIAAEDIAAHLSLRKSLAYDDEIQSNEVLLTADTVVIIDNEVLGKPTDSEDAIRMLKRLSGRTHKVITGFTLRDSNHKKTVSCTTEVTFKEFSDDEITWYVDNFKPMDKAGSYGAQEWIGLRGILSFNGSYHNVVGLPVAQVIEELMAF